MDAFPTIPDQWEDADGDGRGDNPEGANADAFPADVLEWSDTDGDGIGDNGGACPERAGNSGLDRAGCKDSDGDGTSNPDGTWTVQDGADAFPNDPMEVSDQDGDGVGDASDAFPMDATQSEDRDGDGFGDDPNGFMGDACVAYGTSRLDRYGCPDGDGDLMSDLNDAFPEDPARQLDSDRDGVDDPNDAFPFDGSQSKDSDGDGYGDNPFGVNPDAFIDDPTQHQDLDEDGRGDDPDGNDPDVCLDVRTATMRLCIEDRDNDGWNDTEDQFPDEPTQWVDADGDGLGDNKAGYAGDPFLGDKDNDGFLDPSDPVYDEEGRLLPSSLKEGEDVFPDNPSEWSDNDGDLVGDNGDPDDDNDGALDSDELLLGYDAFSSQSTPPESFEIVLTERISLEAWDLVSIALGVPSGLYIIFAFLTRPARSRLQEAHRGRRGRWGTRVGRRGIRGRTDASSDRPSSRDSPRAKSNAQGDGLRGWTFRTESNEGDHQQPSTCIGTGRVNHLRWRLRPTFRRELKYPQRRLGIDVDDVPSRAGARPCEPWMVGHQSFLLLRSLAPSRSHGDRPLACPEPGPDRRWKRVPLTRPSGHGDHLDRARRGLGAPGLERQSHGHRTR